MPGNGSSKKLSRFDTTAIVIGSAIGADIYVVTAVSAKMVGPASLLAWALAGAMALFIAICFAFCIAMVPKEGGPYAYSKGAFGNFTGFMVGWSFLLAELFTLSAFPIAFAQYVHALLPGLPPWTDIAIKVLFVLFIVVTNIVGVKVAGRSNDILTIAKLTPLALIIIGGVVLLFAHPSESMAHFAPFFTGNAVSFELAVVLAFWAYAGFELSTFPADDIEEPEKTVPWALFVGMLIVTAFYLLINFVVIASVPPHSLPSGGSPLMDVSSSIFASIPFIAIIAPIIVGIGALLSIGGANESGMLGTSRLSFALSADGLLPQALSKKSDRFKTPYISILIIGSVVLVMSLLGGLIALINASVLLLAIGYVATCVAAWRLQKNYGEAAKKLKARRVVPALGFVSSIAVMLMVDPAQVPLSLALLLAGLPVYYFLAPKVPYQEARDALLDRPEVKARAIEQGNSFAAYGFRGFRTLVLKARRRS